MLNLSKSKRGTPNIKWITMAFRDPRVEMGTHYYGFIVGLPQARSKHDTIWVIIDRLMN